MHLNLILLLGEKRRELVVSPSLRNESGADPRLTALEGVGVGDGVALAPALLSGARSSLACFSGRFFFFLPQDSLLVCVFFFKRARMKPEALQLTAGRRDGHFINPLSFELFRHSFFRLKAFCALRLSANRQDANVSLIHLFNRFFF